MTPKARATKLMMMTYANVVDVEAEIIAAIEEEREAIAAILKKEAEYSRRMEAAAAGWETRVYHQVAAKTAEHLEREVRARGEKP